jgi:hypothetical protein
MQIGPTSNQCILPFTDKPFAQSNARHHIVFRTPVLGVAANIRFPPMHSDAGGARAQIFVGPGIGRGHRRWIGPDRWVPLDRYGRDVKGEHARGDSTC